MKASCWRASGQVGFPGHGPGEFMFAARALAVDSRGDIYVGEVSFTVLATPTIRTPRRPE